MVFGESKDDERVRIDAALSAVTIPLENLEFTLDQFLRMNGCRLDTETRILLAGARDCVGRAANSARRISGHAVREEGEPLRKIA